MKGEKGLFRIETYKTDQSANRKWSLTNIKQIIKSPALNLETEQLILATQSQWLITNNIGGGNTNEKRTLTPNVEWAIYTIESLPVQSLINVSIYADMIEWAGLSNIRYYV